jgi:hypothetical protein
MNKISKNSVILFLTIGIILITILYWKETNKNFIDETLKCSQLYELKKTRYWGQNIGQSKALFSTKLNTCLAVNINNNTDAGEYFAMVVDMATDKTLLYYNDTQKGFYFQGDIRIDCKNSYVYFEYFNKTKKINEYGCEKYDLMDKMFEKIRSYGFEINDAKL